VSALQGFAGDSLFAFERGAPFLGLLNRVTQLQGLTAFRVELPAQAVDL